MEYKSARLILAPCKAPGRPHLEYGVQLWSLYYGKDIQWIGNRQGGATKKMTQHFGTGGGEREAWRASASVRGEFDVFQTWLSGHVRTSACVCIDP